MEAGRGVENPGPAPSNMGVLDRGCKRADESWLLLRDSYWVMEGLLLSEMASTVKGMLQNFLDLVKT